MIVGIILTHGPIAEATRKAAETILGEIENVHTLSTTGLSLKKLIHKLETIVTSEKSSDGLIIMVSLQGGTCWNAAVSVARKHPSIEVVSGVNLPMMIAFVMKRQSQSLQELAKTIKEDAVRGIARYAQTSM